MKNFKKVLSLALALVMVVSGIIVAPVDAKADETYNQVTSVDEITAGGNFVLVAQYGTSYYALGTTNTTTYDTFRINGIEVNVEDGVVTSSEGTLPVWTVAPGSTTGTITLNNGTSYLCDGNNSTYFSFSTTAEDWTITGNNGMFSFASTIRSGRGIYFQEANLRFGAFSNSNSSGYIFDLLVFGVGDSTDDGSTDDGTTPTPTPEPEPLTTITIAEALAADSGADCKVKGVVTLVDGKNIYVQDATGGICIYCSTTPTDIALGDTIEAEGSRTSYSGLPELGSATYTKSTGLTLEAKTTTIDALTTADIATYVKLTGLTVTEVYDNNGAYSVPNITLSDGTNTIQIYKAVVEKNDGVWAVAVGDTVDVLAAVGVYNTTLQLRNTLASEITVVTAGNSGDEDEGDTGNTGNTETESESEEETESEETYTTVTKDVLEQAAALNSGEKLEGLYQAKGTVTEVDASGFAQYGNIEFTLQLDGMEETILCWRVTVDAEDAVEVGDVLLVKGEIKKYNDIIEFAYPTIEATTIDAAGDLDMTSTVMFLIAGFGVVAAAVLGKKKFA